MSNDSKLFNKDISILTSLRVIRPVIDVFTASFLIAYLLKIAQNDFKPIALYFIFFSISTPLVFLALGNFVKRKNKMVLFRIGIILNFFHLLAISVLKEKSVDYIIWFGISYGFYAGFYASAYNSLLSEKVDRKKMGKFMGYVTSMGNATKIIASYLLGKYIHISSFENCMFIILGFSCLEVMLSFFIKSEKCSTAKFKPSVFLQIIKNEPLLQKAFFIEFLKGMTLYGCLTILITLYTICQFETNLNLGIFNSAFAILTIIISYIFGRYINKEQYPALSLVNSLFIIVTAFLFAFDSSKINFILYNICYATFIQLIQLITDTNLFNISNSVKIRDTFRTEYFAVREVYLCSGRAISYSMLLFAGYYYPESSLKALLISLTFVVSMAGLLSSRMQKELNDNEESEIKSENIAQLTETA